MKHYVTVDQDTCIGCGSCTVSCNNFVMTGDKAKPVKSEIDSADLASNKEAEEGCPVAAIKISEVKAKK